MKQLAISLILGLLLCPCCRAQIKVDGGDGSTVTIGPNGIQVNAPSGGTNLNISPNGISGVAGGSTVLKIQNPVQVHHGTGRQVGPPGKSKSMNTATHEAANNANLQDRVSRLEIAVSGNASHNLTLLARVEKLETDNLGKKGSGTLFDRIKALEAAIGITGHRAAQLNSQTAKAASTRIDTQGASGEGFLHVTTKGNGQTTSTQVITQLGDSLVSEANHISVNSDGQNLSYTLNGGALNINGDRCTVRINGTCDSLIVNGDSNTITADKIKNIVLNGSQNTTTYLPECSPRLIDNGNGNNTKARK